MSARVSIGSKRPDEFNLKGDSNAHSGFGDFDDCDGFGIAIGSRPDLRPGLSGLPTSLYWLERFLLRVRLYLAGTVRMVGIGPGRPVRGQSILCQTRSAQKTVPQVTASFTPDAVVHTFDDPIPVPKGKALLTLRDAA